ncbi:MAG: hypothetical protein PF689_02225 [Deltaproteobacteria bacterium]|jgi:hypothetical protein|nr:hypothetical protein [Deltaproteobacteria bacterium]
MKNYFKIILVLLVMATGSCAENSASLVIIQNQAPEEGCTASNQVSTDFLSHGIIDVGAARYGLDPRYIGWFVVENNLTSTVESNGIELNKVEIKQANVSLNLGAAGSNLGSEYTKFSDSTFVSIPPDETRSVQVNLIHPNVADRLNIQEGQFIEGFASLQIIGEIGGTEIETNKITFPITICYGCLVQNIGPCDAAVFPETLSEGHSCNKTQDEELHCCFDSNASDADNPYRCPAVEDTSSNNSSAD